MNLRIWRGRQHYRANEEIKDGALKNHPGGDDRGLSSAQMREKDRQRYRGEMPVETPQDTMKYYNGEERLKMIKTVPTV